MELIALGIVLVSASLGFLARRRATRRSARVLGSIGLGALVAGVGAIVLVFTGVVSMWTALAVALGCLVVAAMLVPFAAVVWFGRASH